MQSNAQGGVEIVGGDFLGANGDTLQIEVFDNATHRVFYRLSATPNPERPEKKIEVQTLLLVGSKYSVFLDHNALRCDTIQNALLREGKSEIQILNAMLALPRVKFTPRILKDYPKRGSYTFQTELDMEFDVRFEDKDAHYEWKLVKGEKTIAGFKCKKAICDYRGRDYVAWYAPGIPIPNGPYVFEGLPGLILELYDTRFHYRFLMNGIHRVKGWNPVYLLSGQVQTCPYEEAKRMLKNRRTQEEAEREKGGHKLLPRNPIELE